MSGYTPDEKLRAQQLWNLRRKWLKDQELSPREPLNAAHTPVPAAQTGWAFRLYRAGSFALTRVLIPAWIAHYYVKYHVSQMPYGIVNLKPRLFPGDVVAETGEVIPDLPESGAHGHH
ncbi:NADH dehydrogenase [ubiquinone] 1 beta subcomplex subunit 6 [Astyanax mexicanus]|uniref:NADH dehydrogenase [ubiquinone] 1 beta subcomplex subunit 6 n=1 Tax=Astyanax mexicanus TaxID=7994 RepID=A0A8T2M148_ASTMX|nr:NADH dehydrogenase [ubiquinone] 1 beta subcomplex subunit 6 [Astyanax mexicanus]KAG9275772.1 NADH dehydrogenase ubiquinone 1 beta subcomplex subunit 6 [Astyanax mexicanus]